MKKFRKRKIWISSLLALSLLINVLSASAEGADNHSESTTTETEQNHVESPIVNEDVSKRGENEKHFLCEDGSYIAVAYADAVHDKKTNRMNGRKLTIRLLSKTTGLKTTAKAFTLLFPRRQTLRRRCPQTPGNG